MRNLVMALVCAAFFVVFFAVPAHAADALVLDAVNSLLGTVFAVMLPVLAWLAHRGVAVFERRTGIQVQQLHGPALDQVIALAVQYVQGRLAQVADAATAAALRNATVNQAANLVVAHGSTALDALGVTRDQVIDRINLALGAPPFSPAVTLPTQPVGTVDDLLTAMKALMATLPAAPAPEPIAPTQVAAAPSAVTQVAGAVAGAIALMVMGLGLSGCTTAQQKAVSDFVQDADADVASACGDYGAAKVAAAGVDLLAPEAAPVISSLEAYGDSVCNQPTPTGVAGTAVWVGQVTGQILATAQPATKTASP